MAYAGSCGECGGSSSSETARRLVDLYRKSLPRTQLISMHGTHGCAYAARFKNVGWRHDCFGDLHSEGSGVVPEGLNWNCMYDDIPGKIIEDGTIKTRDGRSVRYGNSPDVVPGAEDTYSSHSVCFDSSERNLPGAGKEERHCGWQIAKRR